MKKKNETLKIVFRIVSRGAICSLTGFGTFWLYNLQDMGVFFSMLVGMFISSQVMIMLNSGDEK